MAEATVPVCEPTQPTIAGVAEKTSLLEPSHGVSAVGIPSLTGLRGILALWVVLYHFWPDVLVLFPLSTIFSPVINKGHYAVPAFFILSGVVLAHNYYHSTSVLSGKSTKMFLLKRLARIYPVHFVSLMIVLAMVIVSRSRGWGIAEAGYTWRDFVLNLLLVHTWVPHFSLNWNYPSWSISCEWFAYLFFCPLMFACHRYKVWFAQLLLLGSVIATVAVYYSPKETWFRELICVLPSFAWGAVFVFVWKSKGLTHLWTLRERRSAKAIVFVASALVLASCFVADPYHAGCLLVSLGLLVMGLYAAGSQALGVFSTWPVIALGEVSYSLYMTHTLAQKIVYQLLPSVGFATSNGQIRFAVILVYAVLVIGFAVVMYYAVERPSRKFGRLAAKLF